MKYNDNGEIKEVNVKTLDTLPIGSIVDYDGTSVPSGWEEVADYSTNEVKTGSKWIDGKDIYRKVINIGNLPNSTYKDIQHNIQNIAQVIKLNGIIKTSSNTYYETNLIGTTELFSNNKVVLRCDLTKIQIATTADYSSHTGYVIIEYTK